MNPTTTPSNYNSTLICVNQEANLWTWYSSQTNDLFNLTGAESMGYADLEPWEGLESHEYQVWMYLAMQSQLLLSFLDTNKGKCLASPEDKAVFAKAMVVLYSVVELPKEVVTVSTSRPYPPAEHGIAAGIIGKDGRLQHCHIAELPIKAQELQKKLAQTLDEACMQAEKESPIDSLNTIYVSRELQAMVQELAQDYYNHHIAQTTLPPQAEQFHKSPKAKNHLPRAVSPFDNGIASMSTCLAMQSFTYAIQNAMADGNRWEHPPDHPPYFSHDRNIIEYGGNSEIITDEMASSLWKQVKQQDYGVIDMAVFAISLFTRSQEPDHSAWIHASKFTESRGLKKMQKAVAGEIKRDAGHQQKNYKEAEKSVFHLEKIWMTISQEINEQEYNPKTKKRKQRKLTYKGRFVVVKGVLTQKDLGTTDDETGMEVAWHMAPGDWLAPFLEYPNRQVANLSDRILHYNPRLQKWEKSFGYYFFFNGHMNSKGSGCTFNRYIEPLLKTCSLDEEIERGRPQRTRDRFEKAMDQLVEDRLINKWHYTDHKDGYIPTKRSWIDEWLGLKITIEIAPNKDLLS